MQRQSYADIDTAHLAVMRQLSGQPASSQRELSRRLGWSLGKTNFLVHALLERGLVKAENFRRSNNKVAYAYLLTPRGMKKKLQMTRDAVPDGFPTADALRAELEREKEAGG